MSTKKEQRKGISKEELLKHSQEFGISTFVIEQFWIKKIGAKLDESEL